MALTSNLIHPLFLLQGTILALASCPDLIKVDVGSTKILCPIPIDEQHAFVQELAGDTLTIDIMNGEGNEALKDAFLKFIAVRSLATSSTSISLSTLHWLSCSRPFNSFVGPLFNLNFNLHPQPPNPPSSTSIN